jgi:hypothetical protein
MSGGKAISAARSKTASQSDSCVGIECERIAADQFDLVGAVVGAEFDCCMVWDQTVLGEKLLDRERLDLHAEHAMPAGCEPQHVQRLARQWQRTRGYRTRAQATANA